MPRKVDHVSVTDVNRDHGKTFIITEMDAWASLRWCAKAMLALAQGGTEVPPGTLKKAAERGPEAFATLGVQIFALIPVEVALPLMDEIKACVTYQPHDTRMAAQPIQEGTMCQIEEPTTWWLLLQRAFGLHLGFLPAGQPPTTDSTPQADPA